MSLTINSVGGGASLNFKVVGGASEPMNPTENMIWVETSTDVTSWVFSSEEPSTPIQGMVWIQTGAVSTVAFNALKRGTIMVYPSVCKQYVSGAWANMAAKTYQNGAWKDWYTWYFQSGVGQVVEWIGFNGGNGTCDLTQTEKIILHTTGNAYPCRAAYTSQIDMTRINTLYFDIECDAGNPSQTWCGITTSDYIRYDLPTGTYENPTSNLRQVVSVDVRNVTGSARIIIYSNGPGPGNTACSEFIYNVYSD